MNDRQFRILLGMMIAVGIAIVALVGFGVVWIITHVQVVQNLKP